MKFIIAYMAFMGATVIYCVVEDKTLFSAGFVTGSLVNSIFIYSILLKIAGKENQPFSWWKEFSHDQKRPR